VLSLSFFLLVFVFSSLPQRVNLDSVLYTPLLHIELYPINGPADASSFQQTALGPTLQDLFSLVPENSKKWWTLLGPILVLSLEWWFLPPPPPGRPPQYIQLGLRGIFLTGNRYLRSKQVGPRLPVLTLSHPPNRENR